MPLAGAASKLGDRRLLAAAGVGCGVLVLLGVFAGIGGSHGWIEGLSWVVMRLGTAGAAPAAYILAAAGVGRLARPLFRGSRDEWALQLAVGLGLMLSLSHGLGVLRLLAGPGGHLVALGVVVGGLVLLGHQLFASGSLRNASLVLPLTALPAFGGVALLLAAACSPPGWLWDSEFGGYDALSYHLELPQQWLERGWLWPLNHNVYSCLPGYVESAFMHLGALMGGPTAPTAASPMIGLVSGDGGGVISCQLLHAGLTACAGVLVGRAARLAAERCGLPARAASSASGLAASLFLLTPWTIVVGSMAYNEAGMTALGAGALIAAMDERLPAVRRGALAGLLVGAACGAKPTALTLIGAPVGIALLGLAPPREWLRLAGTGAAVGLAMLTPWLVRNWYACGNPVFPFAASVFGTATWTAEQAARYASGHSFHAVDGGGSGPLLARLRLLFLPEPAGASGQATHRGLMHPQWFAFFPICAFSLVGATLRRPSRCVGAVLALGLLAQLVLWLFTTHVQSRFLVPLAVTGSVAFGLVTAALPSAAGEGSRRGPTVAACTFMAVLAVLVQGAASAFIFAGQRGGRPNATLVESTPGVLISANAVLEWRAALEAAPAPERAEAIRALPPAQYVNFVVPPGVPVYLLGDSAVLYYRPPIIYHTTWDASPLGLVMRSSPGDPAEWTARLRREGISLVLVNFAELERLQRSGWYDPMVTPLAVSEWLRQEGTLIQRWPETGQALFSIGMRTGNAP